jgi:hypothetical protein
MRDHHFGLMASAAFLKWKERQVVHFEIPSSARTEVGRSAARLFAPLPYSHVMQEHTSGVWHVPRAEQPGKWLSLHPPLTSMTS